MADEFDQAVQQGKKLLDPFDAAVTAGRGTAVAEPPPSAPSPTYPTYDANQETLAIWGGGDPAAAAEASPEVRSRRMQASIFEEGRRAHLRALYADLSPRERGAAARSINESLGEARTVHEMAPEEIMAEHLRTKGVPGSPLLAEAGRTAVDFLEAPVRLAGAGLNLATGDTEQAGKAVTARAPGAEERTSIFRGEESGDPLERAGAAALRVAADPLAWFGFGGTRAGAKALGMAGKGLTSAEVEALQRSSAPLTAAERTSIATGFPENRPIPLRQDVASRFAKGEQIRVFHPDHGKGRVVGILPKEGKPGQGDWRVSFGGKEPIVVNPREAKLPGEAGFQGPSGPLGATEKPPITAPTAGAQAPSNAPSAPPVALPALASDPAIPHPAWTAAVDRVTEGMGSWMDAHFPRAMVAIRSATAGTPFHASDRALGALHETYLSNLGAMRGEAADVLGPAEKALKGAGATDDEIDAFFRYASGRSADAPALVTEHPEIQRALDWYNLTLRPRLVERGALSKEALGEFDRYLPNILTAEIEAPGRRSFAFTGAPKASAPRLRKNYPGAVLENVSKDEAQALADSLKGTLGEPVVVGPYGKNSYIKYASEADRDAFLKALDTERRGAGLKSGKIRYRSFEKIPDEWLERSVEEGGGGLVKDPMGLLAHAMDRGTKEIAARDFYESLAKHPLVKDLEPGTEAAKGFAAIPDTPRWGALRGKQVPAGWDKALRNYEHKDPTVLGDWWRGIIRAFKKNVITQTATAGRNALYDMNTLAIYNHMAPGSTGWWKNIGRSYGAFREWTKSGVRPEAVRSFQEGGGLLNGDVLSSEALDRLNELLAAQKKGRLTVDQAAEEFTHLTTGSPFALQKAEDASGIRSAARSVAGGATSAARALAQGEGAASAVVSAATGTGQSMALGKAAKTLGNVYQGTDDFFKIAYFENWRDIFRKAHPDLPAAQINRLAAREVNARSQLVHFKSPIARELTDSGVQPFAWWWDQKVRIEAYMAKNDPARFAIGQAQGTAIKAAAGTAVAASSGIPIALLYDWMKRNPGQIPISAHKDEKGSWIVVGTRYQSALPDPVAAGMAAARDPSGAARETADSLLFSNPVTGLAAKGGALLHGGTAAKDPTFGDGRPLVERGETPAAAALRLYQQAFGSPISPEGRQSRDVRALAEGDTTKGQTQPRTPRRTLAGLAGATVSESPASGAEFAQRRYAAESREAQDWLRSAMGDADTKALPPNDPERLRLWREYESMLLDAFEEALQDGATPPPPNLRTPEGAEKLKVILSHYAAKKK